MGTGAACFRGLTPEGLYMADRGAMANAGVAGWGVVPSGAQAALLLPLSASPEDGRDFMLVLSEFPRGISAKERPWLLSVGRKVAGLLP